MGLISPAEFIPLAEDTGLIVAIGYQVLERPAPGWPLWSDPAKAGADHRRERQRYQFRQHYFVDQVLAALRKTGANPRRLKLELTESLLVHDVESLIGKMEMLKARGVGFALDDFETAIPRSPTCAACRSNSSRSTNLSCATCYAMQATQPSFARSSPSGAALAWG